MSEAGTNLAFANDAFVRVLAKVREHEKRLDMVVRGLDD